MARAIITVGMGFGDEGKGATVDYLCRREKIDIVVRYGGGCQCAHNVVLPTGQRHIFRQFGAGTLATPYINKPVHTILAAPVIIDPIDLFTEANELSKILKCSRKDLYKYISVNPSCLVSTPYHRLLNQIRELARGSDPDGTCGKGIGETRNYWLNHGADAITAFDLSKKAILTSKLELLRYRCVDEASKIVSASKNPDNFLAICDNLFQARPFKVASSLVTYSKDINVAHVDQGHKCAIYEGAQGILLDENWGFWPHVTWSDVTPNHAIDLASHNNAEPSILGITRMYPTRHGPGPFMTEKADLTAMLTDVGNPYNKWQGAIRFGWPDLVMLDYAKRVIESSGFKLNGLAVNHIDHFTPSIYTGICHKYTNSAGNPINIPLINAGLSSTLAILPRLDYIKVRSKKLILEKLAEIAPVVIQGNGPTYKDRLVDIIEVR